MSIEKEWKKSGNKFKKELKQLNIFLIVVIISLLIIIVGIGVLLNLLTFEEAIKVILSGLIPLIGILIAILLWLMSRKYDIRLNHRNNKRWMINMRIKFVNDMRKLYDKIKELHLTLKSTNDEKERNDIQKEKKRLLKESEKIMDIMGLKPKE